MATQDDLAKDAATAVVEVATSRMANPGPLLELSVSIVLLVIIIAVHGAFMTRISDHFANRIARVTPATRRWEINLVMAVTVGLLSIVHLFETLLWTLPIWAIGIIPGFRDAFYYVLEAYTTLGQGNISLPDPWRLVGPIIAISGVFTFSWTGSVLVYVMGEIGRQSAGRARRAMAAETAEARAKDQSARKGGKE